MVLFDGIQRYCHILVENVDTPPDLSSQMRVTQPEFKHNIPLLKSTLFGLLTLGFHHLVRPFDNMLSFFNTVHECERRNGEETELPQFIWCFLMASRGDEIITVSVVSCGLF